MACAVHFDCTLETHEGRGLACDKFICVCTAIECGQWDHNLGQQPRSDRPADLNSRMEHSRIFLDFFFFLFQHKLKKIRAPRQLYRMLLALIQAGTLIMRI